MFCAHESRCQALTVKLQMNDVALAAREIRRVILQQSRRANVGHIGSALSVADAAAVLYARVPSPTDPERDRFILSKGHAALALYAALALKGWLAKRDLDTFCADGSLL